MDNMTSTEIMTGTGESSEIKEQYKKFIGKNGVASL